MLGVLTPGKTIFLHPTLVQSKTRAAELKPDTSYGNFPLRCLASTLTLEGAKSIEMKKRAVLWENSPNITFWPTV